VINIIPEDQICEAFDPMMILPEKSNWILDDHMKVSTSCLAPAYVYIEGIRGKRFLCDYHYYYEKSIVLVRTPEQWALIEEYLIDKIEDVKLTFPKADTNIVKDFIKCWCGSRAYVKSISKSKNPKNRGINYMCNFHYRKMFFRCKSNGVDYFELYDVVDERYKIQMSIKEEYDNLPIV
jgi:hypothetical protein